MDVFFVDESPQSRSRLTRLLRTVGVQAVGHAESARAALAALLEKKPDVVLLDLKLDEGSGFDVLRELRSRAPGIDVYMLSNYASEPYRRYALRLGAADFFDKTTELERLCAVLAARAALTRQPAVPL